jgi:hypothetical protein
MAFKGFQLVAAIITVSELGDIHRFSIHGNFMGYLVCSSHCCKSWQRTRF